MSQDATEEAEQWFSAELGSVGQEGCDGNALPSERSSYQGSKGTLPQGTAGRCA